jgi:hypothetical protein
MSTSGTRRHGRVTQLVRDMPAEGRSPAAEPSPAKTPYRLLWSTGIVAGVLGIVAFVLWGMNGAGTLFDMMVAFCT